MRTIFVTLLGLVLGFFFGEALTALAGMISFAAGEPFDPERIDADPELGDVELWRIRGLNLEHPIHLHLVRFQVLTVGGGNGDTGPYNQGWKDTVSLSSGGETELLVRFDGYRGKYVFRCHNLEHEDMMMMANFEVV